eukprot:895783-Amphidinium_carterae.1
MSIALQSPAILLLDPASTPLCSARLPHHTRGARQQRGSRSAITWVTGLFSDKCRWRGQSCVMHDPTLQVARGRRNSAAV